MRAVRATVTTVVIVAATIAGVGSGAGPAGAGTPDDQHEVFLRAGPTSDTQTAPLQVLDRLRAGDLVDISLVGGVDNARGVVRQCTRMIDAISGCVNSYPVQFGDRGDARLLYRVTDPGSCGPQGTCVLVVGDIDDQRSAAAALVFGAPAPPQPTVSIVAGSGTVARHGETVQVEVGQLVPGARIGVAYCSPVCDDVDRGQADTAGRLTVAVVVGDACTSCGIAVIGTAHDTLVRVPLAAERQPGYDPQRLVVGLVVAGLLLVAAWRIVAAVDWRPPSEAATPELDAWEP